MLVNMVEKALMNNPVRAAVQRHLEVRWLKQMGGQVEGGRVLEIGCGRGVGTKLILDEFGVERVDAFDLDPHMVELARQRLRSELHRVRLWVGDAEQIDAPDNHYDAVFDFGIIHHCPDWQKAIAEVQRVLKPDGRFFAEEVLDRFILNPLVRTVLDHPLKNRFGAAAFANGLTAHGFNVVATRQLGGMFAWFVATKRPLSHAAGCA